MSKHNYTKYSSDAATAPANMVAAVEETVPVMPVIEAVEETVPVVPVIETAEETVPVMPVIEAVEETVVVQEPAEALDETVDGTVVNCAKLNVRANPNTTADVVCVLTAGSEIEINIPKSTDEWFNVYTAAGVEGYCMRKFVNANL